MLRWLANLITTGNLLCGTLSVIMSFDGHWIIASWLILFAVVLDAFDGKAARFFGGSSAFGLEYDSLADVISFGLAPAILIYGIAFQDLGTLGSIVCVIPVVAAAVRLARFNANANGRHHDFVGLSSPLHAGLISSFVVMSMSRWGEIVNSNVLAGLVIISSLLMVSQLPLAGLPKFTLREQGANLFKLGLLAAIIIFAAVNPPQNAFPALLIVVTGGFIAGAYYASRRASEEESLDDDDDESITITR